MEKRPIEGLDRAAMLLLCIGEKAASEVLKHLPPKLVQKVGASMSRCSGLSKAQIDNVVEEFLVDAERHSGIAVDPVEYTKNVLKEALGNENANMFLDQILTEEKPTGLDSLRWLEPKVVVDLIRNEHPQTIATILNYLDPEQSAEILRFFPADKRVDMILRMSEIQDIKPEALAELGRMIDEQILNQKSSATSKLGGIKKVADVINQLDDETENQVLDDIKAINQSLCEAIKNKMFIFDNLVLMDAKSIQRLLRDINHEVLLLALKGADDRVKEKVFANMSRRAGELLRDDLEAKGPVKLSEVERAQKEVLDIAKKLAEEGMITLGGKSSDLLI